MRRCLLCTDMDRTLIPNGAAAESAAARELFARLVARPEVSLAYVTGRHLALIEEAIHHYALPVPDFAIADVGTTIYEVDRGHWQAWQAWSDEIDVDWQRQEARELYVLLHGIEGLRLQESEKQNRHKLSFYVPLTLDATALQAAVAARLESAGLRANLVWSIDEEVGVGLLDILPASANKRHAVEFLMQSHGFGLDDTIFAGDSGNDLDVMLSPIHSVLVANASEEVRAAAGSASAEASVYVATGGFLGMNGNYAAGILEGVAHFLPDAGAWLEEAACGR